MTNIINKRVETIQYYILDVLKFCFALLIPLLHIDAGDGFIIEAIRQYISRLGVPFFFATSGFLIGVASLDKHKFYYIYKKQIYRILYITLFWFIIYFPIWFITTPDKYLLIKEILFRMPGYLWYLIANALGILVFEFFYTNYRKRAFILCVSLYIAGVLGNSWSWLNIFPTAYYSIFLTTRNGLFFAPLFIFIGMSAFKNSLSIYKRITLFVFSYLLFFVEVSYIHTIVMPGIDTSMYFTMPLIIYFMLLIVKEFKFVNNRGCSFERLRKMSILIYCMQYGVFTVVQVFGRLMNIHFEKMQILFIDYSLLIILSCIFLKFIQIVNNKWLNRIV